MAVGDPDFLTKYLYIKNTMNQKVAIRRQKTPLIKIDPSILLLSPIKSEDMLQFLNQAAQEKPQSGIPIVNTQITLTISPLLHNEELIL